MTSDAVPTSGPNPVPPTGATGQPTTPAPASKPVRRAKPNRALKTRTGYTWISLVAAAVIGILLLVFILQNLEQERITLFFWTFSLPMGVTVLLSVIGGALVMALVGGWRILQLRRAAKRG